MTGAPGDVVDSTGGTRLLTVDRDAVAKSFSCLVICTDGTFQVPVVTLRGDLTNVYNVIEQHLRDSVLVGNERFWKLIRETPNPRLETWRPRVGGIQLKVLKGARLPETDGEWLSVQLAVGASTRWLREDSSPKAFLQDIKAVVTYCQSWWGSRTQPADRFRDSGSCERAVLGSEAHNLKEQVANTSTLQGAACASASVAQYQRFFLGDTLHNSASVALGPMTSSLANVSTGGCMGVAAVKQAGQLLQSHMGDHGSFPINVQAPHAQHALSAQNGQQFAGGLQQLLPQDVLDYCTSSHHHPSGVPTSSTRHSIHGQVQDGSSVITLNVGGHRFNTTAATLTSVVGSLLWSMVTVHQKSTVASQRSVPGVFFIDRNGMVFEYILEYLRVVRFGEPDHCVVLPADKHQLAQILREAEFFGLPGLAGKASEGLDAAKTAWLTDEEAGRGADVTANLQFDSVNMQTAFHPVNSNLDEIQGHEAMI